MNALSDCSVSCKMSRDELEGMCRKEGLHCQDLGVTRANARDYEVEFLCDYKKMKVRNPCCISLIIHSDVQLLQL